MEYIEQGQSSKAQYIPNVHDNYSAYVPTDGRNFNVSFWDVPGREENGRLRPLSYPETDFFILCFSIDNPKSLQNLKDVWVPEYEKLCTTAAKILVGNKEDKRNDPTSIEKMKEKNLKFVEENEAIEMQKELGAFAYLQTSAWTHVNVDEIVDQCLKFYLKEKLKETKKPSKDCIVM
jgi:small GTP-binding protein